MHTCPFCTEQHPRLITIRKDGQIKQVCPGCLPGAIRMGWVPT